MNYLKNAFCPKDIKKVVLIALMLIFAVGYAMADSGSATPYLQYKEPEKIETSFLSAGSYIFSLLATFLLVLFLAYFTSRLIANKMKWSGGDKDGKIISCLSFGSNRGVYLVEIAGKYLLLGVTEHNINLLREVDDEEEIEKIRGMSISSNESFDLVFRRQISSLQHISQKFPKVFNTDGNTHFERGRRENQNTGEEDRRR
jgi:flagellar protein FliO/FliZ